MSFDPERLIAALPIATLSRPGINAPDRLPEWRWPLVCSYNGFGPVERIRHWQITRWLIDAGCMSAPVRCSICGDARRVSLHSEMYGDPTRSVGLCHPCHMAVHRRFRCSDEWRGLCMRHACSGEEWFVALPLVRFDLAEYTRCAARSPIAPLTYPALAEHRAIIEAMPQNLFNPG